MDKLSKAQKDEYATAFAILALYDGGVSDTRNMLLLGRSTCRDLIVARASRGVGDWHVVVFSSSAHDCVFLISRPT